MSDIKLVTAKDSEFYHDLDLTNQEMTLVEDEVDSPAAIAQEMRIAMQFGRGEWDLNVLIGIPFRTEVFIKNPSLAAISVLFTRAARSVPGIIEVPHIEVSLDRDTRILTTEYEARAQNGGTIEDRLAVLL